MDVRGVRVACLLTVAWFCAQPSELGVAKVWHWYLQLQQAEAAFRCAKSDLSLRSFYSRIAADLAALLTPNFASGLLRGRFVFRPPLNLVME